MRKTSSYLKGLAETRARVAGDMQRYTRLLNEVQESLTKATLELAACDRLICKFDERLDPALIRPIRAWKGRYGKRGSLQAAIKRILEDDYPAAVTTTELSLRLQLKFQLDFASSQEYCRWRTNSLVRELKRLVAAGHVERLHDTTPTGSNGEVGRWRWRMDCDLSLDHLRALAEASGVEVQECDDVPS